MKLELKLHGRKEENCDLNFRKTGTQQPSARLSTKSKLWKKFANDMWSPEHQHPCTHAPRNFSNVICAMAL